MPNDTPDSGGADDPLDEGRPESLFLSTFRREPLQAILTAKGIHPDDVATLARWAPLALTHLCWRNSVLEDWHGGPESRISDGAMFMGNVDVTRIFGWAVRDMFAAWEIDPYACLEDVAQVEPESLAVFLFEAVTEIVDPERVLPHGVRLSDIGGDEVDELREHAETQVHALCDAAEEYGTDVVLLWLAARATSACANWWGGTGWHGLVDRFLFLLEDPAHERWSGRHPGEPPGPGADREWLRYTLLTGPDRLGLEVADWCTQQAAIGYVANPAFM